MNRNEAINEMWGLSHDAEVKITELRGVAKQIFADERTTPEEMRDFTRSLQNVALTAIQVFQDAENIFHTAAVSLAAEKGDIGDGLDHWEIPVVLTYPIVPSDVAHRYPGDAEIDFKDRGFERIRSVLNILIGGAGISWYATKRECRRVAK